MVTLLGAMTAGFVHDLNNALVAVLGYAGLGEAALRAAGGNGRVLDYLNEIALAGERARLLGQELATLLRRDEVPAPTAAGDVLREVVDGVAESRSHGITLATETADALPDLAIERSHLVRLLRNLLRNAFDATERPGTIRIVARLESCTAGQECASCGRSFAGEYLLLSVADEGPGVPHELRRRVFAPFFTTAIDGSHSGLGLTVVDRMVHWYGGHVQIVDRRPRGAEFVALLPVLRSPETAPGQP